jgi:hypothetical protein
MPLAAAQKKAAALNLSAEASSAEAVYGSGQIAQRKLESSYVPLASQ